MGPYTAALFDYFQISHRIGIVSFHHCLREANKAANNLATLGYNLFLLDGDPTPAVLSDVINSVSLLNSE
jgi:hypothetical protein